MAGLCLFLLPWKSTKLCLWRNNVADAEQTPVREQHVNTSDAPRAPAEDKKVVQERERGETMGIRLWRRASITPPRMVKAAGHTGRRLYPFSIDLCSSWDRLPGYQLCCWLKERVCDVDLRAWATPVTQSQSWFGSAWQSSSSCHIQASATTRWFFFFFPPLF